MSGLEAAAIARSVVAVTRELRHAVAALGVLNDQNGKMVDEVLVTWFRAPHSYTAEDVVEISCHGAPVILHFCLERCFASGARPAEPGEFTLRAFLNGRIDLPQAEAVRDLIESTTLHQARTAARQLGGSVARQVAPLKAQLVQLIALLEAGIDFAEDDIAVAVHSEIVSRMDPLITGVRVMADSYGYGRLVHPGFTIALVGRPNSGKSSLFNRLIGRERAIVADVPGTTRDVVSEVAQIDGIPVTLADTAGIRETSEVVEGLGIERSWVALADADLVLVVIDGSSPHHAADSELVARTRASGPSLVVANKSDLPGFSAGSAEIAVSALRGTGIPELRAAILRAIAPEGSPSNPESAVTSARQAALLRECLVMLEKASQAVESSIPHEMLLLDLYGALQPLDAITGATTADDILNRIFSSFCIGK